ncbi:MAG TPA: polysaccharide biosynthesis/export family protein [Candidatus Sulfotelmatobacter sp.]|jgi:polysaccharide export outer membrane protein
MKTSFVSAIRLCAVVLAVTAVCAAQGEKAATPAASLVSAGATAAPAASSSTSTPTSTVATAANTSSASTAANFPQRSPRYHIEPGDTFDLTFELSPEFNQVAVAVQPDGFVTLRGVGDLKVADQTVPELTQTLRMAYSKILNDPLISVVLKDFEKPYFVAGGQVAKPGKYDMHGHVTVTQAIEIAGGFQSSAKHSQVMLFRRLDDQWTEAKLIDVKKMEKKGNLTEDPFLHPGDMLIVPKNTMSKIDRYIPNLSMGTYLPLTIP